MSGFREEVLNVMLAVLLGRRGFVTSPETIQRFGRGKRHTPDVLVLYKGLRLLVEGKYEDSGNAEAEVLADVQRKVDQSIGHIGVAVIYPARLRSVDFNRLERELEESILQFCVYYENGLTDWVRGGVDLLATVLAQAYQVMAEEDVVDWGVELLNDTIEDAARTFLSFPALPPVLLRVLEMDRIEEESDRCAVAGTEDEQSMEEGETESNAESVEY